jgi:hypothetical protein
MLVPCPIGAIFPPIVLPTCSRDCHLRCFSCIFILTASSSSPRWFCVLDMVVVACKSDEFDMVEAILEMCVLSKIMRFPRGDVL